MFIPKETVLLKISKYIYVGVELGCLAKNISYILICLPSEHIVSYVATTHDNSSSFEQIFSWMIVALPKMMSHN